MYNTDANGNVYQGEVYTMDDVKEVHSKFRDNLSSRVTIADIYVAINSQYHDYFKVLNKLISESEMPHKITIEGAISFWFMDKDNETDSKIWIILNVTIKGSRNTSLFYVSVNN